MQGDEQDLHNLISDDEEQYLSYPEIYRQLLAAEELILIIDKKDEQNLRRRLTVLKSKDNAKLKEAGAGADESKLEYIILPSTAGMTEAQTRLQIVLKGKSKIRVYSIKAADDSLV